MYIEEISHDINKNDNKKFWQYIKSKSKNSSRAIYSYNNKSIDCPEEIVNSFADNFKNVYSRIPSTYHVDMDGPQDYQLDELTEDEILNEISSIPVNKPPGPDNIPPMFWKNCAHQLKTTLCKIFNCILKTQIIPPEMKKSNITPVPKKSSNNITEHRPISNLSCITKIFEGIIYTKISPHVFSIISEKQHGFVNGRSTVSNLAEFLDFTARTISMGQQVDVCYSDIEKCFDQLSHDAILKNLVHFGFSPPVVKLFANYLKDRELIVKYQNFESMPYSPPSGVIQGSKLSSLLFILTFNMIPDHIKNCLFLLYADDLKIFRAISTLEDCNAMQADLNAVSEWLLTLGLNFHPDKCHVMTYTNKKSPIHFQYTLNQKNIQSITLYKDLGVTFQSDLSFNAHINDVTQ